MLWCRNNVLGYIIKACEGNKPGATNLGNIMASIYSSNKGSTLVYETDKMGCVTLEAMQHRNGAKECFIKRDDEVQWKAYGIENYETIVSLTKYQVK